MVNSGYTDFPSRLPTQSSTLYSNNITKFLLSYVSRTVYHPSSAKFIIFSTHRIGDGTHYNINLEDEVVRGSIIVHNGNTLAPVPRVMPPAPSVPPTTPSKAEAKEQVLAITPWQKVTRDVALLTGGMGGAVALGKATGAAFMDNIFTFGLAGLIGYVSRWLLSSEADWF